MQLLICPQDMGENGGARAADVLGHTQPGSLHLAISALATQLLGHLHDLVHAGGSYGVAAGLQAAAGTYGNLAPDPDRTVQPQAGSLATLGEAASFQREGGHDGEGVM